MAEQVKSPHSRPRLGRGLSSLIINSAADPVPVSVPAAASPITASPTAAPPAGAAHQAPAPGGGTDHQPAGYVSDGAALKPPAGPQELPIDQIGPNPYQPRREFKPEELAELAQSIVQQGLLQPIVVTPSGDGQAPQPFVLVAGERRLRAAKQAGLVRVPCIIRRASRQQMLEWALIENIQRTDLNPVERANAYRDCMDRFGLTAAQLADRLGEPRTTVTNYLRIIDLCDEVQKLLLDGSLSFGHAKALLVLAAMPDSQLQLARLAANGGMSVRQLEKVADMTAGHVPPKAPPPKAVYIRDLEERLTAAVGSRVTILRGKAKYKGRIVIEFYSLDDFDRISAKLGVMPERV
ncbi:MAG: ParB/RepB/Spo0J family partition protein [Phycisphaerae bacterium]